MCEDTITSTAAVASAVVLLVVAVIVAAGAWTLGKLPIDLPSPKLPKLQKETAAVYFIDEDEHPPSMEAGVTELNDPYAADTDDRNSGDENDQAALVRP